MAAGGGDVTRLGRGRRGLLVIEGLLLILSVAFAIAFALDANPDDPGLADVGLFGGPLLAVCAAVILSGALMLFSLLRWLAVSISRALLVTVGVLISAPIVYVILFFILWNGLDALHLMTVQIYAGIVGILPVLVTIAIFRELARAPGEPGGRLGAIIGGIIEGLSHTAVGSA